MFLRLKNEHQADADRVGLKQFLDGQGLRVCHDGYFGTLVDAEDRGLAFDGSFSDLHLDPLDQPDPVSGGILHATLSLDECRFIFALCLAGQLLVVNPQEDPIFVVVAHNHHVEDLPDDCVTAWADNAEELASALDGSFRRFLDYRNHMLGL